MPEPVNMGGRMPLPGVNMFGGKNREKFIWLNIWLCKLVGGGGCDAFVEMGGYCGNSPAKRGPKGIIPAPPPGMKRGG